MKQSTALKIIWWISMAGLLFSGYLSYGELVNKVCPVGGGCTSVLGLPSCVYGFIMYAIIFIISGFNMKNKEEKEVEDNERE